MGPRDLPRQVMGQQLSEQGLFLILQECVVNAGSPVGVTNLDGTVSSSAGTDPS